MKYLSDFEHVGFMASEIIPFLANYGINISNVPAPSMSESLNLKAETTPEWKQTMSLMPFLTHIEAAYALADFDIDTPCYLSDEAKAFLARKETLIVRAIVSGELAATETDYKEDDYTRTTIAWDIARNDLMAWCAIKGIPYPLPISVAMPQTDTGLREALATSESERATLRARVAELEAQGDHQVVLQAEVSKLRSEIKDKADKLATISLERDKLKADSLAGKARTTALKVIGGLATSWITDIHSERLDGIGDIEKALQSVGAAVDPKTLRTLVKEGAGLIEKINSKI
jgi:hypothetical protein